MKFPVTYEPATPHHQKVCKPCTVKIGMKCCRPRLPEILLRLARHDPGTYASYKLRLWICETPMGKGRGRGGGGVLLASGQRTQEIPGEAINQAQVAPPPISV
jgi:hypothetical protein